ncbi:MAG TPA: DUF2092 domain-containing protein [Bauldia sp.]|nr:DUF2092 domain-containing protein [Bauldia sp.]
MIVDKTVPKRPPGRAALAKAWTGTACLALALAAGASTGSLADEADARTLFKAMSDYMAAQTAVSFDYDSTLEIVTTDGQKLALASSGAVTLARPDKLRMTRTGGFADVEAVFDGTTLSLLGKNLNAYAQVEVPGTVDQLVDTLRDKYHRPLPAADLLLSDVNGALMPDVTDVKDLGSGVIGGIECDHLAFRTEAVDWQIWIAQGEAPHPCRFVITSSKVAGSPEYTIDIRDWKAGTAVAAADFAFTPPEGATKVDPEKLKDFDELPSQFIPGDAK